MKRFVEKLLLFLCRDHQFAEEAFRLFRIAKDFA